MKRLVTHKERIATWAAERIGGSPKFERYAALGLEEDGVLVAAVLYDHWYHPGICGHIATDGSKRWANRQFLQEMFRYPFEYLGCTRITAPITEGNDQAVRFVEKLGFVLEGRLRKAMPDGSDRLIYGLLKEDCKWI